MTGSDDPSRNPARRAEKPRQHPEAFVGLRVNPSPELMAALRENPGGTLRVSSPTDSASDSRPGRTIRPWSVEQGATVQNFACPGCGVDFSLAYVRTTSDRDLDPDRDIDVSCPTCLCLVTVAAPQSLSLEDLVVGPPRTTHPSTKVLQRARTLRSTDASLNVKHSERIAALELERDDWQMKARTDVVTGLLNERAHTEDTAVDAIKGHAVFELETVQAVYDYCGQSSGNQYARDAAGIIELAAGPRARVYRIGTAKFALIAADLEAVRLASQAIKEALRNAGSSFPRSEGDDTADAAPTLEEFLAQHPKPYGLDVRLKMRQ